MQGLHRLAVVAVVATLAALGAVGPAAAQYAPAAAIACDTSTVQPGEAFTCTAGGFRAGSQVVVTATGATTGATVRSSAAAGQWTYETTVTAAGDDARAVIQAPGNATGPTAVTFTGVAPDGQPRVLSNASAVTVAPSAGGDGVTVPAPVPPSDGVPPAGRADGVDADLPATGTDVASWLLVVTALLVVGTGLVTTARRRRRARVDT